VTPIPRIEVPHLLQEVRNKNSGWEPGEKLESHEVMEWLWEGEFKPSLASGMLPTATRCPPETSLQQLR